MYGPQIFWGQFSLKFNKSLKIYLLLHFSSNLLQIFRKCSLHCKKKKTLLMNFNNNKKIDRKNKVFLKKVFLLKLFKVQSNIFYYFIKIRL